MSKRIHTIDATLNAYGPETSIKALWKIFNRLLTEEHPDKSKADIEALKADTPGDDTRTSMSEQWHDLADELPKCGAKHHAITMTLPEMNERFLTMELMDMRIAKTCTVLLRWHSDNDDLNHQVTWVKGAQETKAF